MDQDLLTYLNKQDQGQWKNSWEISLELNISHDEFVGILKSLENKSYLKLTQLKESKFIINQEGQNYAINGTPEFLVLDYLQQQPEQKADKTELQKIFGSKFAIALKNGMKTLFVLEKNNLLSLHQQKQKDEIQQCLQDIQKSEFFDGKTESLSQVINNLKLKKRKLVDQKQLTYYTLQKGEQFSDKIIVKKADLTMDDINKGLWQNKEYFKTLNLKAKGKELNQGGLHPLMKMRSQFRQILIEMGFQEMDTKRYVESSFWNFDSLFQPQQHPAREAHDTFFIKNPEKTQIISQEMQDYVDRVQTTHEQGFKTDNETSSGWVYKWDMEESRKNIMRTHTTAVSSRYLYEIAQKYKLTGKLEEKKLFSIDRVFRNETLDSTHLAEFHQVEGLIVGKNLGLPQLKCFIRDFFKKIGIDKLKFKPAYNPYTEPSMEIFVYHPQLKKTIEIGNSGIFRQEMLKPMGFPEDTSVIAWGLSLERPAMIRFQCSNIRELLGDRVDLNSIRDSEIIHFN